MNDENHHFPNGIIAHHDKGEHSEFKYSQNISTLHNSMSVLNSIKITANILAAQPFQQCQTFFIYTNVLWVLDIQKYDVNH